MSNFFSTDRPESPGWYFVLTPTGKTVVRELAVVNGRLCMRHEGSDAPILDGQFARCRWLRIGTPEEVAACSTN